jgi:hypothetical protein
MDLKDGTFSSESESKIKSLVTRAVNDRDSLKELVTYLYKPQVSVLQAIEVHIWFESYFYPPLQPGLLPVKIKNLDDYFQRANLLHDVYNTKDYCTDPSYAWSEYEAGNFPGLGERARRQLIGDQDV